MQILNPIGIKPKPKCTSQLIWFSWIDSKKLFSSFLSLPKSKRSVIHHYNCRLEIGIKNWNYQETFRQTRKNDIFIWKMCFQFNLKKVLISKCVNLNLKKNIESSSRCYASYRLSLGVKFHSNFLSKQITLSRSSI